jgi:hypothetical protein
MRVKIVLRQTEVRHQEVCNKYIHCEVINLMYGDGTIKSVYNSLIEINNAINENKFIIVEESYDQLSTVRIYNTSEILLIEALE